MLNDTFRRRFDELATSIGQLRFVSNGGGTSGTHAPSGDWQRWGTSVQSLIRAVYGASAGLSR